APSFLNFPKHGSGRPGPPSPRPMLPRRIFPHAPKLFLTLFWALLLGWPRAGAAVDKVICVPWQGDPLKYHTGIDGLTIQLKAVVKTTDGATVWYKWVF